ncbi:MAG: hypothetical protein DRO95_06235 [Candidatus Altiarchaeales archaeon]|nr:MAG: hypothetical protein DRO95_06235 [Candidatus Altiarchaeales archaeon]
MKREISLILEIANGEVYVYQVEVSSKYVKSFKKVLNAECIEFFREEIEEFSDLKDEEIKRKISREDISYFLLEDIFYSDIAAKIVFALHVLGRVSIYELSKKAKIPYSSVHRHIKELERFGIVTIIRGKRRAKKFVALNADIKFYSDLLRDMLDNWDEYRKEVEKEMEETRKEEKEFIRRFKKQLERSIKDRKMGILLRERY